jgi:hypothetical protein
LISFEVCPNIGETEPKFANARINRSLIMDLISSLIDERSKKYLAVNVWKRN